MPTIPGSPTEETEYPSISPLMSRAPPPPPPPPAAPMNEGVRSPTSPSDDVIPDEHKRVPGLIPRSPLSPIRGFMARRGRKSAIPPPIIINPPRGSKFREEKRTSPVLMTVPLVATPIHLTVPPTKPKRKTVWGMIEGWWDLGLIERMNTVRRKNLPK
ncbi:hypothetical protein QBC35DRAFT_393645 [Podospora australis]|uniref:Uncharacterized protein n=1 Tax=Podospora australis TaxID=1536484 RepID=A0AAN6WKD8_9PEZI|nr:hypothetical protein QBC35DRAFT_393645 [Podospora australis]